MFIFRNIVSLMHLQLEVREATPAHEMEGGPTGVFVSWLLIYVSYNSTFANFLTYSFREYLLDKKSL